MSDRPLVDDETGVVPLIAALQHVGGRHPVDHEDPRHAQEPDRDEQAPVREVSRVEGGARHEDRDEKGDDRDVRGDHEVLDRYEDRRVALRIAEQRRENDGRREHE